MPKCRSCDFTALTIGEISQHKRTTHPEIPALRNTRQTLRHVTRRRTTHPLTITMTVSTQSVPAATMTRKFSARNAAELQEIYNRASVHVAGFKE